MHVPIKRDVAAIAALKIDFCQLSKNYRFFFKQISLMQGRLRKDLRPQLLASTPY